MKSEFRRELEAALGGNVDIDQAIEDIERALRPKRDGLDVSLVARLADRMLTKGVGAGPAALSWTVPAPISYSYALDRGPNRKQRRAEKAHARKGKR